MSKIESGRITLNRSSFDLINVLNNLEKMLHLRAASKNLELLFEYAQTTPQYIETDEKKLCQVLLNLLGNAIKFTDIGRVTLRVRLEEVGEQRRIINAQSLIFEVQDTGCGIALQDIDLVFEAFEQTEIGKKSQQGTGLGLAISRKYVQLMGGNITVSSMPGIGSTFTFDVQITVTCAREIPTNQIKPQILALAPTEKAYRILVVDDSKESRLLLVKILMPLGFEVMEATDGMEAVANWESWQPHLIFMDMRMPIMNGYEATRMIKAREIEDGEGGMGQPCVAEVAKVVVTAPTTLAPSDDFSEVTQGCSNKHTIIIAVTANAFEEERQKILSIGCDDFIRKPFTQEVLLEQLSQHLGVTYTSEVETTSTAIVEQPIQRAVSVAELLSQLSQMSPEWLQQMHYAAASCSDELILELIKQIPSDRGQIFQVLRDLANNYQFEKIMELTK